MLIDSRLLLTLTATITPDINAAVVRKDPSLRRADYLNAFRYWVNHPDPRLRQILFAENSGADLTEFHEAASKSKKSIEIISTAPVQLPPGLDYGYSELLMIDQALSQSLLRQNTTHMIKMTGRLTFPALPKLLNMVPDDVLLAADARSTLVFRRIRRGLIKLELFLVNHDFYDTHLRQLHASLLASPGYPYNTEHFIFEHLEGLAKNTGVFFRFPVNCEPVGYAAHAGKRYDRPSRHFMTAARALSRVIAPKIWL